MLPCERMRLSERPRSEKGFTCFSGEHFWRKFFYILYAPWLNNGQDCQV